MRGYPRFPEHSSVRTLRLTQRSIKAAFLCWLKRNEWPRWRSSLRSLRRRRVPFSDPRRRPFLQHPLLGRLPALRQGPRANAKAVARRSLASRSHPRMAASLDGITVAALSALTVTRLSKLPISTSSTIVHTAHSTTMSATDPFASRAATELRDTTWRPLNEIQADQTVADSTRNVFNAGPAKSCFREITSNGMARSTASAMPVVQQRPTTLHPPVLPVVDGQPWGLLLWAPRRCLMGIHHQVDIPLHRVRRPQDKAAFVLVRASRLVVPGASPSAELPSS